MARNKYFAKKTVVDGIKFDSMKESRRYTELKLLERAGKISELKLQPSFDLKVNDVLVCKYVADFSYNVFESHETGSLHVQAKRRETVIEDVKGMKNSGAWRIFRIKAKLLKAIHGIDVRVV